MNLQEIKLLAMNLPDDEFTDDKLNIRYIYQQWLYRDDFT